MNGLASVVGKKGIGRGVGILAVALLIMAGLAPRADADTFEIVIPVDTVQWGTEGEIRELADKDVPEEFFGHRCEVTAVSRNQDSVHPGNNLIVDSGGSSVVLEDVEGESQLIVEGSGQLVLGSTIVVSLEFGSDAVFSAGIDVVIDCTPPTTEPPTTEPPTTEPPPPVIETAFGCDLETSKFVVSATNVGSVDVLVGIVWDSGNTSDDLKAGEVLTAVVPAGENWTIFEENVPVEQGTAESCDEVSPTSITATTAPEVSPETLPFTGAESGTSAAWALVLVAGGILALVGARSVRAGADE